MNEDEKQTILRSFVEEFIPFNKLLEIKLVSSEPLTIKLAHRPELVGNALRQMLHGGVIASVLDVAGGSAILANLLKGDAFDNVEDGARRFGRTGTIDLRVDYLRPGKGEEYIATARIIRHGSRITVTRMELHNELGTLIALGTGTYVV